MTKDWTPEEIEILRARRAERVPVPLIAKELGRAVPATYARARLIGTKVMERRAWEAGEVARLIDMDERRVPIADIARAMGRPEASVRWKLEDIGRGGNRVKRWTAAELRRLRRAVEAGDDLEAFARDEGRPLAAVEERARAEGFVARRRVFWNDAREKVLREGVADLETVAEALGMPLDAVAAKARRLGLLNAPMAIDAYDDAIRAAVADGAGLAALARRTGRAERFLRDRGVAIGVLRRRAVRRVDEVAVADIVRAARGGEPLTAAATRLKRDVRTLKAVAGDAGVAFAPGRTKRPEEKPIKPIGTPFRFGARKVRAEPIVGMDDAVAAFLATRGATRAEAEGVDKIVLGLRRRGFSVVGGEENGWTVDGRTTLADVAALKTFAAARGITAPA